MVLNYLIDENVNPIYTIQLRRLNPDLFILAVGDLTTPEKGTLDPEILLWCEKNNFILVTNNRKSMPVHFLLQSKNELIDLICIVYDIKMEVVPLAFYTLPWGSVPVCLCSLGCCLCT